MKLLSLALIVGLTLAVVWLTAAVVRLENYRYANSLGMCSQYAINDRIQRILAVFFKAGSVTQARYPAGTFDK